LNSRAASAFGSPERRGRMPLFPLKTAAWYCLAVMAEGDPFGTDRQELQPLFQVRYEA